MQLTEFVTEVKTRFTALFAEKQAPLPTDRCCISFSSSDTSLVCVDKIAANTSLLFSEAFAYNDINELSLILSGFVKKNDLAKTPIYWLLAPDDYQIFLIESLPVKAEELKEAVSWRVRSLINYPIEEAVIDYFMLPPKKSAGTNTMIAAVITKTSQLNNKLEILEKGNLNLTTIDIPELAMRNLTSLYEDDEKSTAFIYFYQQTAILNITSQKKLYFTRRINFSNTPDNPNKQYEELGLEILRYFDYFQSQWRFPSPTRIFISAEKEDTTTIAKLLSQYLSLTIDIYSVKPTENMHVESLQGRNLLAFGCTLRESP